MIQKLSYSSTKPVNSEILTFPTRFLTTSSY